MKVGITLLARHPSTLKLASTILTLEAVDVEIFVQGPNSRRL